MTTKNKVKLNHSLKVAVKECSITNEIVEDVKSQFAPADLKNFQYNNQLVLDVCNYVENNVKKRISDNKQYNKKNIVLKVFSDLFPEIDLNIVDETIETFHENGNIKKSYTIVTLLKKLWDTVSFFLRM